MIVSIVLCLICLFALVSLLRRDRVSLGLPIAYLFSLLFIHIPGAVAHLYGGGLLLDTEDTEVGIRYTAIGVFCFVVGVWFSIKTSHVRASSSPPPIAASFAVFCVVGGLGLTYGLSSFTRLPSIGAVIEKGGGIWVLGVLLGLQASLARGDLRSSVLWLSAMMIYPLLTLLLGGFLSFGSTPVFIALSALAISTYSRKRVLIGAPIVAYLFFTLFLSYFDNRDSIRESVWGGGTMGERVDKSMNVLRNFEFFDIQNPSHLDAMDRRLNQNFFVGRSANRIENNEVDFLYGRSFWEGLLALVPRAIWPSKPVFGGSPEIVMKMTGFIVNDTTSYGVGNVMEFYINFGIASLVLGFFILGWLLGWLDRRSAQALGSGQPGSSLLFFMPAAAMIHPNGSLVELVGGGASAFIAALAWRKLWIWINSGRRAG